MDEQQVRRVGIDEQILAVSHHRDDVRADGRLELLFRRLAPHVELLATRPHAANLRADRRFERASHGLDFGELGHACYLARSASASAPNSGMSSVSPRRPPSIAVATSAASIAASSKVARNALRSVFRR